MPVYEYKCTECTERFEVEQRISDDPLTSMEGCTVAGDGQHRLKKVFSSIGISFKGGGFYRNDSRSGSSKSSSSASTKSDSSSGSNGGDSGSNGTSETSSSASSSSSSTSTSTSSSSSSD
ncbi:MAG: FmdB family zinc ribbon protein [Acidimicrobiales bacterium]